MKCWFMWKPLASAFGIPLNGKADLRKSSISSLCFQLYWDPMAPALLKPRFKKGDRVYGISFLNPKGGFLCSVCCCERNQFGAHPGKAHHATSRCHGR